ncbi:MAG: phosphotransferase family protein, partial [Gammaproteobacteria bacterium]
VHHVTGEWSDGTPASVIVRQHREMPGKDAAAHRAAKEWDLLQALTKHQVPAPTPIAFLPPDTLALGFVPGSTELPDRCADALADALASLQAVPTNTLHALPSLVDPLPALHDMLPHLTGLDTIAARLPGPPDRPCLMHGDFWPGNVLWSDGVLQAVIDWEDAALGDPLIDVACARAELARLRGPEMAAEFTAAWARRTGADLARLPLWDLFMAAAILTHAHQWGLPDEALRDRLDAARIWRDRALAELGLASETVQRKADQRKAVQRKAR